MKKQRPGVKLSVLCGEKQLADISGIIFRETTSIGLRYTNVARKTLRREIRKVKTEYGDVKIKAAFLGNNICSVSPEYDDCRKLAEKCGAPVRKIYETAKIGALKWLRK